MKLNAFPYIHSGDASFSDGALVVLCAGVFVFLIPLLACFLCLTVADLIHRSVFKVRPQEVFHVQSPSPDL